MKSNIILIIFFLFCLVSCNQPVQKTNTNSVKAQNIILLIGDGMGVSQIYAGMTAKKEPLNIEQFKIAGFSKTYSASDYITDSGAGGTAIATGYKTYNKAIGVDEDTIPRKTILEYAEENGKATGLVATSQVTHATPASFIAHQKQRYMYEEIAEDFLKTDIDVFIGGGLDHFSKRKDSIDLTIELRNKGYHVAYNQSELKNIQEGKLAGLLYANAPPRYSEGRGEMLVNATSKAIELLSQNGNGFFLMIEGSQIDWGSHDNNTEYVVEEMIDFDNAIGIVMDFAAQHKNTLVIVTADHETGGMGLNKGNLESHEIYAEYTSSDHTSVMVPVFAYGPGAEEFGGIQENTDLFHKMFSAFGFKSQE